MRKPFYLLPLIAIASVLLFAGCEKWRENRQFDTVYDNDLAEGAFNDMFRLACQEADYQSSLATDSCYTVSASDTVFPKTVSINFGSSNCNDYFQFERRGTLVINYNGDFSVAGSKAVVTPGSEYYFDNFKVEGTLTITYEGLVNGKKKYTLSVGASTITTPAGETITWACNRTFELMDEVDVDFIYDDLYKVTGTASGVDNEGRAFQTTIVDNYLVKEQTCRWYRAGIAKIAADGIDTKEVNYGNEDCDPSVSCCDNYAKVKTNGKRETDVEL